MKEESRVKADSKCLSMIVIAIAIAEDFWILRFFHKSFPPPCAIVVSS